MGKKAQVPEIFSVFSSALVALGYYSLALTGPCWPLLGLTRAITFLCKPCLLYTVCTLMSLYHFIFPDRP